MARREERVKRGLYVEVRNNDVTRAYRKLKRLCQDEGIMQEVKDRKHYEKPSAKRKRAKAMARKRWLKKQKQIEDKW